MTRATATYFAPLGLTAAALPWLVDAYTVSVLAYGLVLALAAAGTHLLLAAGLPSLGQGAYLGIGAYTAAWGAEHLTTSAPTLLAIATAAAAAVASAAGLALVHTRGTAFMILTLMGAELAYVAAAQHGEGVFTPATTLWTGQALIADGIVYLYCLVVAAAAAIGLTVARRSRQWLLWRGLEDNEIRVRANGHHVEHNLWTAYIASGAAAGAAGALLVTAHRFVGPADMSTDVSALLLLSAIIGGRSPTAAMVAAVGLVAVRDLSGGQLAAHTPLLLGAAFIAAAFLPRLRRPEVHSDQ